MRNGKVGMSIRQLHQVSSTWINIPRVISLTKHHEQNVKTTAVRKSRMKRHKTNRRQVKRHSVIQTAAPFGNVA